VLVHDGWEDAMCVGAGADEEEDDQQQRLEVEKGRLSVRQYVLITVYSDPL
jgi:hypothetical protein